MIYSEYLRNGEAGKVNVVDLSQPFLDDVLKKGRMYTAWNALKINDKRLNKVYQKVIQWKKLKKFCEEVGEVPHVNGEWMKLVEWDSSFEFYVSYTYTMALFIYKHVKMPTPQEFWDYWVKQNKTPYQRNLSLIESETTLRAWCRQQGDYSEAKQNEGKIKIENAAKARCARAYCGLVRDYYVLASLAYMGYTVWCHPLIDISMKCDGIVVSKNQLIDIAAVAVYLDTTRSHENCERKAANIPDEIRSTASTILDVTVGLDKDVKESNCIALPTTAEIVNVGKMLNGDIELLKLYKDKDMMYFYSKNIEL